MSYGRSKIPVAADECGIGIIVSEDIIIDTCRPDISLILLPVLKILGTCDHGSERDLGTIGYTGIFRTLISGYDMFAVYAGSNDYLIAGRCDQGRIIDVPERHFAASVTACY